MKLNEIITNAMETLHMSQTGLAKRIGLQPTALSHVMSRRRNLPAEAAIELSELTGESAKKIWLAALNWRARDDSNVRPLPSEGNTLSN